MAGKSVETLNNWRIPVSKHVCIHLEYLGKVLQGRDRP